MKKRKKPTRRVVSEIDMNSGPAVELWDDDGPMTSRISVPMMYVRGDATQMLHYAGPHRPAKVLRAGLATVAVWFPDREKTVPAKRVNFPTPVPLEEGTFSLGGTPLFATRYDLMFGEGVHD